MPRTTLIAIAALMCAAAPLALAGPANAETKAAATSYKAPKNAFGQPDLSGYWKDLKVVERFTRVGKNSVRYAFTAEDPGLWDKPWGGEYEFSPLQGVVYEYACHEGNYALPGILAGARAQEAEAAKKAAMMVTPAKSGGQP